MLEITPSFVINPSFPSVKFCQICDNATPQVWIAVAGEAGCVYCWEAYGECN